MSHLKERKEKTCLNCQTSPLYGRYCHVCGQENLEPKETVWHLILHFFNDITHFDGKFFNTVGLLLRKPGFLSSEYMIGRRSSYLNPIRMYVFTSAIFFLILFSLKSIRVINVGVNAKPHAAGQVNDTVQFIDVRADTTKNDLFGLHADRYKTVEDYERAQDSLPANRRDGLFKSRTIKGLITMGQSIRRDSKGFAEHLVENFTHSFPKILFFSLPFFALILRLLYIRRKEYFYVDHGIFTIHVYCAVFIFMLADLFLGELANRVGWAWLQSIIGLLVVLLFLYIAYYLYRAMLKFYRQGWLKTLLKYVILCLLAAVVNLALLLVFLMISIISVI